MTRISGKETRTLNPLGKGAEAVVEDILLVSFQTHQESPHTKEQQLQVFPSVLSGR